MREKGCYHLNTKRILSAVLAALLLAALLPATALAAVDPASVAGSTWSGKFNSYLSNKDEVWPVVMNLTIDSCSPEGKLTATGYTISQTGHGYDGLWFRQSMEGTLDLETGAFELRGVKVLAENSRPGSYFYPDPPFVGTLDPNHITGVFDQSFPFDFARTSNWSKDEITEAETVGLVPDALAGKNLASSVSRGEFAAVAVRLYETLTGRTVQRAQTPFQDIAGDPNRADIEKAFGLNIAVGTSATQFSPDTQISREQLATMLCRTIKKFKYPDWSLSTDGEYYLDTAGVNPFADDADISDYAKPSVYYMTKMGIINGISATLFAPRNVTPEQAAQGYANATREQAVALSLRIFKLADVLGK